MSARDATLAPPPARDVIGRAGSRLAVGAFALGLAALLATLALEFAMLGGAADPFALVVQAGLVGSAFIGQLIVRRTGNTIGWIFLSFGTFGALWVLSGELLVFSAAERTLPAPTAIALVGNSIANLMVFSLALIPLLFPTGRLLSPRWRWVLWVWAAGLAITTAWNALRPGVIWGALGRVAQTLSSPFGTPRWASETLITLGASLGLLAGGAGVVSLILRARRAEGEERQQIRLLAWVAAAVAALLAMNVAVAIVTLPWDPPWVVSFNGIVWFAIMLLVVVGMPVTVAIAIMKYRLFEIDVVVRKTIVYGSLALFTTAVYVVVVVIVGRAIGAQQGSLALSVAATALVAVAFQPVRDAFERLADRMVYGRRATPYEVLARFSDRVGEAYAIEDVLPRTARVLGEGVRAERATVWLRLGDDFVPSATWPDLVEEAGSPGSVGLEAIPGDRVAPVRYLDEVLGALAVTKPRDEPLSFEDVKLVDDLAAQAGLVLANVRMTADLEARLASIQTQALELRASRQRIVAAQDAERRRLERNIHDGAQQHLVAMAVRLRLVRGVLAADPQKARTMLGELEGQIDDALETLRGLSAGIYPPLLQDEGPAAALADHARSAPVPVTIEAGPPERHPIELEAAIYFCVLEGLQNATKYAAASAIAIELGSTETSVWFEVRDDGVGFDPSATLEGTGLAGMRDRLAVLGGRVTLRSRPGEGTSVRGEVPLGVRTVVGVGGAP